MEKCSVGIYLLKKTCLNEVKKKKNCLVGIYICNYCFTSIFKSSVNYFLCDYRYLFIFNGLNHFFFVNAIYKHVIRIYFILVYVSVLYYCLILIITKKYFIYVVCAYLKTFKKLQNLIIIISTQFYCNYYELNQIFLPEFNFILLFYYT